MTFSWQEKVGVTAQYDKVGLVPGRRLWEQIANKIMTERLAGWAYLVTPQSLESEACREELAYALHRALGVKGEEFPLIGLVHQVGFDDVPAALRVRLCVDLRSPDWVEQVKAGLSGQPPGRSIEERSPYVIQVHNGYGGNPNAVAVEVRPRFGELTYWRIAFPADGPKPTQWGSGPAGGGGISPISYTRFEATGLKIQGIDLALVGCANALSGATSAYIVFQGNVPDRIFFGIADQPLGTPTEWLQIQQST